MNKNILKLICDVNKDNIRNELLDEMYIGTVVYFYEYEYGVGFSDNIINYVGSDELDVYKQIYICDKKFFNYICKCLFKDNENIRTIFNEYGYYTINDIECFFTLKNDKYIEISDKIKEIINKFTIDDFKNFNNYQYNKLFRKKF